VFLLAFLIFVVDYGLLFWAEQRVPSGIAAVILATIPAFMALSEIIILRTQRLTARLSIALLAGIAGVAVLMSRSIFLGKLGGAPIDTAGAAGLIVGAIGWSIASALARKLPLPSSKVMSSGTQMLAGGAMLAAISAARGEGRGFHLLAVSNTAWIALAYLIFAGSIAGFTAYVWLLHRESPTKAAGRAHSAGRSVCSGQRHHHHQHAHQDSRRGRGRGMIRPLPAAAPRAMRKFTPEFSGLC
jgi:drug/metabolite transporter (DMT)-like permease